MKELSTEKKAMAYDKVVNKLKCFMAQGVDTLITRDNVQDFFSELKESEDWRIIQWIRKELEAKYVTNNIANNLMAAKALDWLSNQEFDYTFEIKAGHWYKCVCDYMLNGSVLMFKAGRLYYCRSDWRLGGEMDERNVKNIGVNGYKSFFRPATKQEIKDWIEGQGEQNLACGEKIKTDNLSNLDSLIERLMELKEESSGNNCDITVHLGKRKFKIVGAYLDSSPLHHKEEIGMELENRE